MIQYKLVDEISLSFPKFLGKYQKYHQNWTKETVFVYILGFIFYGVSHAKTDLHNTYVI